MDGGRSCISLVLTAWCFGGAGVVVAHVAACLCNTSPSVLCQQPLQPLSPATPGITCTLLPLIRAAHQVLEPLPHQDLEPQRRLPPLASASPDLEREQGRQRPLVSPRAALVPSREPAAPLLPLGSEVLAPPQLAVLPLHQELEALAPLLRAAFPLHQGLEALAPPYPAPPHPPERRCGPRESDPDRLRDTALVSCAA